MIFHRLGLLHKNQRGFTLIELVIALLVTGIITSGITMTIFQVFNINTLSRNHMLAVRQVQNAGYWVSQDAQMAQPQYINTIDNPVTPERELVTLSWTDYNGSPHTVIYTLDLVSSELWRDDGVQPMRVAQFIDPDGTSCVWDDVSGVLTLTVTATVGTGSQEASETRVYEIMPRPNS